MKISTKDELMKLLNEASAAVDGMEIALSSKAIKAFKHLSGMMLLDIGEYVFKNWSCYHYLYHIVHDAFNLGLGARAITSTFQSVCDQHGVGYEIYTRNDLKKIIFNENVLQGYPPVFVGGDDEILECSMVH